MNNKWVFIKPSYFLQAKDFYISYTKDTTNLHPGFAPSIVGNVQETALYHEKKDSYYILKGDWSKEYEEVFHLGLKACLEVYKKNKGNSKSQWEKL